MNYKTYMYLYFDCQESKLRNRIQDLIDRIFSNKGIFTADDMIELYTLRVKLDFILKIQRELYELIDF